MFKEKKVKNPKLPLYKLEFFKEQVYMTIYLLVEK